MYSDYLPEDVFPPLKCLCFASPVLPLLVLSKVLYIYYHFSILKTVWVSVYYHPFAIEKVKALISEVSTGEKCLPFSLLNAPLWRDSYWAPPQTSCLARWEGRDDSSFGSTWEKKCMLSSTSFSLIWRMPLDSSQWLWLILQPLVSVGCSCPAEPVGCVCVGLSVVSDSLWCHGLLPARLLCPWDSPDQNTEVDCHSLLQKIFPTQGLNSGLLYGRQILYCVSYCLVNLSSIAHILSMSLIQFRFFCFSGFFLLTFRNFFNEI